MGKSCFLNFLSDKYKDKDYVYLFNLEHYENNYKQFKI